ncbi:MAG: hypoxanthine phosphoribosyltransferase [Deltaproteobacteria bacterium]|nr:hypoxanthine phosphoribosyltransferase [Deltaproteobacteria bacterium]
MSNWADNVETLISQKEIHARIEQLGRTITLDYKDDELVLIGVLKGSFLFMADLCRQIDNKLSCDFFGLSSYGDKTKTSGVIRITSDLKRPIEGKNVLVVEDIVDTGLTMQYLLANLQTRKPKSVKVCTLLEKPSRKLVETQIDYLGFEVPDVFVVGYGLDYKGRYRNLEYIGQLKEESLA